MLAVAERRASARETRETAQPRAADWRDLLLRDLCAGRDGARLRRTMRAYQRKLQVTRSCADRREQRCAPRRMGYRTRAARALVALDTAYHADPREIARHEARIRFALRRIDDTHEREGQQVRADRMRIALEILEYYVRRAEAFLVTLEEDIESVVA